MRRIYTIIMALAVSGVATAAQDKAQTPAAPTPRQEGQGPRQGVFDLTQAGVQIKPDQRLIIMMAALDAAGFDPTPQGEEASVFRAQLRKDQAGLDPDLRKRLTSFYERNKLRDQAGKELPAAEQAARYVSLAYALGAAPSLEEPPRTDDLPGGLLEVLDFAPLVREFYRRSGIDERMPAYVRAYQSEGDRMRRPVVSMVRNVLQYLNTRPITTTIERVPVNTPVAPGKKKDAQTQQKYTTREHERRFVIVPDLLAAPGAINFRVIADDYFVTVPYCDDQKRYCAGRDDNPASQELRRAYIRYVFDPIVVRFSREIATRREQIKQLLAGRGEDVSPDVFLAVARSLVIAADVRMEEVIRLNALTVDARSRLDATTDASKRAEITRELETARSALADESAAQLAEGYESGAVLAFFFAEQLRGVESSGFDVSNSIPDMLATFDPAREARRLGEADAARKRALAARKAREAEGRSAASAASLPNAALVKKLLDVDKLVQLKNYAAAEERLLAILREFPGEARVFFSLAEVANLSARDATDEMVQEERLNKALVNYSNAVKNSTPETDRCLLVRAHEAMGRIHEFQERREEAIKEFDAAVSGNDTTCGAFTSAVEGRKRLRQPPPQ